MKRQFLHLASSQTSRGEQAGMAAMNSLSRNTHHPKDTAKPRSRSLGAYDGGSSKDIMARMKLTDEFMHKPLKGNVRGLAIQESFPTFQELFRRLPEHMAFNVEISKHSLTNGRRTLHLLTQEP